MIQFNINPYKALEAIVYLATKQPNIDHYHVVKTIFYADKYHLNKYGRPVIGDVYKKMPAGPVPSLVLDIINFNSLMLDQEIISRSLQSFTVVQEDKRKLIASKRDADLSEFSETDIECLDQAFAFCKDKTFDALCKITHKEKAWKNATEKSDLDYALFLDDANPNKDDILQDLEENSQTMVV